MKKIRVLSCVSAAAAAALALAAPAQASPVAGHIGVGISETLGAGTGANIVYDAGIWHADGTLSLAKIGGLLGTGDTSILGLSGHGWYHLNSAAASDFSVGGGLSFYRRDPDGDPPARSAVSIDIGFQIRAFVTSNVSVSGIGGLSIFTGDADGYSLGGEPLGAFAFTYFF